MSLVRGISRWAYEICFLGRLVMRKQKIIFSVICLLGYFMFFPGCNGGSGDSTSAPANPTATQQAKETVQAAVNVVAGRETLDLIDSSQRKAANGAIAEVQARATNVYSSNLLKNASPNDCAAVLSAVNAEIGTLGDFTVKLTSNCPTGFTIAVVAVKGQPLADPPTGTWRYPGN